MTSGASELAEQSGAEGGGAGRCVPGSPGLRAQGKGGAACCQVRRWQLISCHRKGPPGSAEVLPGVPQGWPLSLLGRTRP